MDLFVWVGMLTVYIFSYCLGWKLGLAYITKIPGKMYRFACEREEEKKKKEVECVCLLNMVTSNTEQFTLPARPTHD